MFDIFTKKCTRNYTAAYTINGIHTTISHETCKTTFAYPGEWDPEPLALSGTAHGACLVVGKYVF